MDFTLVQFQYTLDFVKMKYFEADLAEDTIGAEKAISSLVRPPGATKPTRHKKGKLTQ